MYDSDLIPAKKVWYEMCQLNKHGLRTICLLLAIACFGLAIFVSGVAMTEHARHDWPRAQGISCVNNLKQIGVGFRTRSLDNADKYPCNVPTNAGGVMEVCEAGADGFEKNPAAVFQVMSNELSTPGLLLFALVVCVRR
jgi:hypothetical protein